MLLLLDQNVPAGLARLLPSHDVRTAFRMGWAELENGALLSAAENAGFDVMISSDQNLSYQQNLSGRSIAVLILSTNMWPTVRQRAPEIERTLDAVTPGSFHRLTL